MFTGTLALLVQHLKKLPGIGNKSARRMAMHLIRMNKAEAIALAESIKTAVEKYRNCSVCNLLSEDDPCQFCRAPNRRDDLLCIVENTQDVYLIEETNEFNGRYFVLSNLLSPIDGIGPDQINFPALCEYLRQHQVKEIILALNPSAEGESTINFLAAELATEIGKITRLSTGIPFGGDIEYTTSITLGNALKRRYKVNDQ
ncbi:MAG: recombination protein RecR [Candidatus Cloacimonetes bacterium]|nr:recombination protein RecR [Candidatus Cloacimonadota bacterium]